MKDAPPEDRALIRLQAACPETRCVLGGLGVQSLLSIPANALAFPLGTANQRFTLEVARKMKMLVPDMKIMLLDPDCRMHVEKALPPGTPVDLLLAGEELKVSSVVDFLNN